MHYGIEEDRDNSADQTGRMSHAVLLVTKILKRFSKDETLCCDCIKKYSRPIGFLSADKHQFVGRLKLLH